MKTIIKLTLAFCMSATFLYGQEGISTRDGVYPAQYRSGVRPAEGTFGLSFFTGDILFEGGTRTADIIRPAITFKYYNTDQTVFRIGLYFSSDKEKITGDNDDVSSINSYESKYKLSKNYIYPAVEFHLNNENLIDVYAVISGRVGMESETNYMMVDQESVDLEERSAKTTAFGYGLGAGLGLQAFVADLPLSIGLEVGFFANGLMGLKTHVEGTSGGDSFDYYTADASEFDNAMVPSASAQFESMKARVFDLGTGVRFSITYYFNN